MRNFRSLQAYNFFTSGWVGTVRYVKTQAEHFVFRADVKPSMRVNDSPHHPWITVENNGMILAAHCDCMAGLGESCSHVAAVLFKVEAAVRLGYTTLACTEVPCQWNNHFVKKVECDTIQGTLFYKPEYVAKVKNSSRKTQVDLSPPTLEMQETFLQDLCSGDKNVVGLSLFETTCDFHVQPRLPLPTRKLPALLRDLYDEQNCNITQNELNAKIDSVNLSVSVQEADYLEQCTTDQSGSLLWHAHRAGRITASVAHSCLHTSMENPSKSLLKKISIPNSAVVRAPALDYGREKEKFVFDSYSSHLGQLFHKNFNLRHTGMRVSLTDPWLSASADGKFTCSCHGFGLLEIKAPYRWRANTVEDAVQDEEFYIDSNHELKKSHQYYTQIQIQMYVYEYAWCDFVVYFGETNEFFVKTIAIDREYVEAIVSTLKTFWQSLVLPELLTRKNELLVQSQAEADTENKLYCFCKKHIDGAQMVGCDNPDCPYEWIHLQCIRPRRKTVPKGKWFCRDCKKSKKA